MPNSVSLTPLFESRYKRLARKFSSLEHELSELVSQLEETATIGESLGAGLYKIRLASKSKGKGKRGGFRIITYLLTETPNGADVYLITIYDKSEDSTISKDVLVKLVRNAFEK